MVINLKKNKNKNIFFAKNFSKQKFEIKANFNANKKPESIKSFQEFLECS